MIALKQVLVPTDFSACAQEALDYALKLAKRLSSRVVIVHAYQPPITGWEGGWSLPADVVTELEAAARFAVMAVVILPLLPEGPYGPAGGIRPRELWALVLLFAGLSFAGYIARRVVGAKHGYPVAGLLGGLMSSTSVTLAFSRASRDEPKASLALYDRHGQFVQYDISVGRRDLRSCRGGGRSSLANPESLIPSPDRFLLFTLRFFHLCDLDPFRGNRLANHDVTGRRTGNRAAHDEQVVLGIHLRDPQVANRDAIAAHASVCAHALDDARRKR